jgi:hypothetical protein
VRAGSLADQLGVAGRRDVTEPAAPSWRSWARWWPILAVVVAIVVAGAVLTWPW